MGHVSNKGKTQKEAVEAISSLSDRQFSIVAEIAPLFGTQFRTTNIFGSPPADRSILQHPRRVLGGLLSVLKNEIRPLNA